MKYFALGNFPLGAIFNGLPLRPHFGARISTIISLSKGVPHETVNCPLSLIACVCLAVFSVSAEADVPSTISYRGRLVDATGAPVADGANFIRFVIYDSATAGTELWNSGIQEVPTSGGLFTYQLGSNTPLPAGLFDGTPTLYLGINVGADPEITPRTMFTSSAFAHHARRADTATIAQNAILLDGEPASSYLTAEVGLGDITGIMAIDGLTGGGTTGDVTVSVAPGGITAAHIADGSVGAADINSSQVQRRVSGSAGAGQAIRAINPDGSVTAIAVGNGDITAVTAGAGLSGGGSTGSVTLNISTGGVASAEILDGSVGEIDLANNSVGTNEIIDGSVSTLDIGENAIGGFALQDKYIPRLGIVTVSGGTTNGTPTTVDSISFTAPGDGWVLLTVSGGWWYNADATSSSSLFVNGAFYLSTVKNSANQAFHNGAVQFIDYVDPDNVSSANSTGTLSFQRLDPVSDAVVYKYFLNISANGIHRLQTYVVTRISAVFVSNNLFLSSSSPVSPTIIFQPEEIQDNTSGQH